VTGHLLSSAALTPGRFRKTNEAGEVISVTFCDRDLHNLCRRASTSENEILTIDKRPALS